MYFCDFVVQTDTQHTYACMIEPTKYLDCMLQSVVADLQTWDITILNTVGSCDTQVNTGVNARKVQ